MVLTRIEAIPAMFGGDEYARIKDINNVHNAETWHLTWIWREMRALVEVIESDGQ